MSSRLSRDEVVKLIKGFVNLVSEKFRLHAAILFGSYARGDYGPWSDVDLLLLGEFGQSYLDRVKVLMELAKDLPLAIEPHPYTVDEALKMLGKGSPTIVDAIEEGIRIFKDDEFEKITRRYREMLKDGKLKRTRTSITF